MQNSQNYFVTKNYLENNFLKPVIALNTGFDFWARGNTISQTALTTLGNYTADCWTFSSFPASQTGSISRASNFATSNKLSQYCWNLSLTNATTSLPALSQYILVNRLDGNQIRHLLGKSLVVSGKARTNKAGTYSVFVAFLDTTSNLVSYSSVPITLLGNQTEEAFEAHLPISASNFIPVLTNSWSGYYGIVLAGNKSTVTGISLTVSSGSEAFCHPSQVNIFDNSTNYFQISQFQIVPDIYPKAYLPIPYSLEKELCRYYYERITPDVASAPLSLGFADGSSLISSSLSYREKRIIPAITISSPSALSISRNGTDTTSTAVTFNTIGLSSARMDIVPVGTITGGEALLPNFTNTSQYISIDASL